MENAADLYERIIAITDDYLGPASERFVNRQISNHLHIEPDQLQPADLPALIQWIKITISVLTEDSHLVNQYITELSDLVKAKGQKS